MLFEQLIASSTRVPESESLCPWGTNTCSDTRTSDPFPGPRMETECAGEVLGDISRQNQVFAATGQNLAEPGFDPRTFGL